MTDIPGWPQGLGLNVHETLDSTNEAARRLAAAGERGPLWIVAREQTAFAAGLAVAETVAVYAPNAQTTLKWPNDVLLDGKKAAGILLESLTLDALAIGIGINLAHHPTDTEFPAISIADLTGSAPDWDAALLRLAGAMAAWYEVWREQGFAPVRTAWLARAAGLGRPIRARLEGSEMQGVFENLDEDGALLLRQESGTLTRITAGEVFFRT